jgi:hypothetical protein
MPGIDKAAFLKKIGSAKPDYGDSVPGSPAEEAAESPDEEAGELSCGEQLMEGIKSGDASMVDAALREAVAKYGQ